MTDPVLRDLLLASVRQTLGLRADASLPLMLTVEEVAKAMRISRGKAYDLAKTGELPGQITRDRPIRVSTFKLLALLGGPGQGHPSNGSAEAALAGTWSFSPPGPDHSEAAS